jgi:hypothetical protein
MLAVVLCWLNLLLLAGLVVLAVELGDPRQPTCPALLRGLPLGGLLSAALTGALLIVRVRRRRGDGRPPEGRWRGAILPLAAVLFLPFLVYWNLLGLPF